MAHSATTMPGIAGSRTRRRARAPAWLCAASLCSAWLAASVPWSHAATPLRVIHPVAESARDARPDYPLAVLRMALDASGVPYRLQSHPLPMQQARALRTLDTGDALDVVWTVGTAERERRYRQIPVAIDRGMIGWRRLLVRREDLPKFERVRSLDDLRRFRMAQGHDWPDVAILRENGIRVEANPTYAGLFGMLARRHVDAVPRSIEEISAELDAHRDADLAAVPGVLLHYPAGLYFHVARDNAPLADALERGLRICIADGRFERLFREYNDDALAAIHARGTRVIALRNPDGPRHAPPLPDLAR